MRRIGFLSKLKKEGKLEMVEPSDNVMKSYLAKSGSNTESANILLRSGHLEESVVMAYYSMYHAASAILFGTGIKCENHAAVIIILKEVYGIDNSDISYAKNERIDKQYYVDFEITREEVKSLIRRAERFNSMLMDFASRKTNSRIGEWRKRLEEISG
ncbi:MAG: HEPN domain-containing protein [Candidatus Aenigmarchaeota archaeon]|nr:HEPN domain-containing protein [Candidatus Aenigmarchaeota archaeon]